MPVTYYYYYTQTDFLMTCNCHTHWLGFVLEHKQLHVIDVGRWKVGPFFVWFWTGLNDLINLHYFSDIIGMGSWQWVPNTQAAQEQNKIPLWLSDKSWRVCCALIALIPFMFEIRGLLTMVPRSGRTTEDGIHTQPGLTIPSANACA